MNDPITTFLAAIETATIDKADVYAADAELDATCPNWRFRLHGPEAIRAEYAKWFNEPLTFVALDRMPVPGGEVVTYEHEWVENGVRHRGHHAHHIRVAGDRIVSDAVWCGGRWSESLLEEMGTVLPAVTAGAS